MIKAKISLKSVRNVFSYFANRQTGRQKTLQLSLYLLGGGNNCATDGMNVKDGGLCTLAICFALSKVIPPALNMCRAFWGALHRPAETLVIMSQPPAACSDCLNINILEEPSHRCGSAKLSEGTRAHFRKFNIRLITYATFKHTNAGTHKHSFVHADLQIRRTHHNKSHCMVPIRSPPCWAPTAVNSPKWLHSDLLLSILSFQSKHM